MEKASLIFVWDFTADFFLFLFGKLQSGAGGSGCCPRHQAHLGAPDTWATCWPAPHDTLAGGGAGDAQGLPSAGSGVREAEKRVPVVGRREGPH